MARKLPTRVKRHQGEADPSQIHLKGEQDCLQLSWRKDGRRISKFTRGRYDTISVSASSEATEQLSSRTRFWIPPIVILEVSTPKILLFSFWYFMQIDGQEA